MCSGEKVILYEIKNYYVEMFFKIIYCLTIILSIHNNVSYLFLAFQHLFKL